MSIPTTASATPLQPPVLSLGQRLTGQSLRIPLVATGLALASLWFLPGEADAAVLDGNARSGSIAAQTGLEPIAQQREGRRGGGGEFRGNRGGGGAREARVQNRSNIGTAQAQPRQQFRQERRADRQDFRQERRGDVQGFRQERRGDQRDFRQERRGDRQDLRQGVVTQPQFRADRREDRRDFRVDRRDDRRDFRTDRRDDRRDFQVDRRGDRRDFRQDRRYDNRSYGNNGRNFGNDRRDWNRGWRNDRRYDWYGYRNQNRNFYRVGRYYPPVRGWNYRRFNVGFTLGAAFYGSNFWINDPWSYRLPPAYGQYRWVRYYGDVLLVDIYTGQVVDVINDFFW